MVGYAHQLHELFDPEKIIFAGPLADLGALFLATVCENARQFNSQGRVPAIETSTLGKYNGAVGASAGLGTLETETMNSGENMSKTFVTHLEGAIDGERLEAGRLYSMHKDRPIWVRYDLDGIRRAVSRDEMQSRPSSLWRWPGTPARHPRFFHRFAWRKHDAQLLRCPRLGDKLGLSNLWIKDESQLPTGSFKSRGQTVAISMAKEFGIKRVAIPTAGNAGGAMAAYAARAGMEAYVFMPADTPLINQFEAALAGAKVLSGRWPDHRLRPHCRGGQREDGLVRYLHSQGAVSD